MPQFKDALPEPNTLLKLEPEEVGSLLLAYFNGPDVPTNMKQVDGTLNQSGFLFYSPELDQYASQKLQQVRQAFAEAWAWLEREGLLARWPDSHAAHLFVITRRGREIRTRGDAETYKRAKLLPDDSLYPILARKVAPQFLRGDYDTAVFQAFKEVEVRVRNAARLDNTDLGVKLMRKAFNVENGPLSDTRWVESERQSTSDLFAGAIGLFKNPQSHRNVQMGAVEASELINFASYLLRLIDVMEARSEIQKEDIFISPRT